MSPTQIARGGSRPGALLPLAAGTALALACVPISVLFTDRLWVAPALVVIVAVVGVGGVLRASRVPLLLVPVSQSAAFAAAMAWLLGADAAAGAGPWRALLGYRDLVVDGIAAGRTSTAPVDGTPEFLALVTVLVFLAALLLETLAVGMGLAGMSGIIVLLMAAAPLGIRADGATLTLLAGPAVGWLLLLAADETVRLRSVAMPTPARRGLHPAVSAAGLGAASLACAALVVVAAAPGASDSAWLRSWWNGLGSGSTAATAIDPLVSVRSNLTSRSSMEILRYRSSDEAPRYLAMTTLEEFDGTAWRPPDPSPGAPLTAPAPGAPASAAAESELLVEVTSLANRYLPVPEGTVSLQVLQGSEAWAWDRATGDVVGVDGPATGTLYRVAAVSAGAEGELQALGGPTGPAPSAATRRLPAASSDELQAIAAEVTAGAVSDYDRGLALQRWFTSSGGFTYSLDVPDPGDRDPLLAFLSDRTGFCQQFATGMAALSRSLDIPARVVVGFTGGESLGEGTYRVNGANAHAWPELWVDGSGWVRFEPTPASASTAVSPPPPPPEPAVPDPPPAAEPGTDEESANLGEEQAGSDSASSTAATIAGRLLAAAGLGVIVCLPLAVPTWRRRSRRRHRLRRCREGDAEAAWQEIGDSAVDAGLVWPRSGTLRHQAAALLGTLPDTAATGAGPTGPGLAGSVPIVLAAAEVQRYAPSAASGARFPGPPSTIVLDEPGASAASAPQPLASAVEAVLAELDSLPRTVWRRLVPRSLHG